MCQSEVCPPTAEIDISGKELILYKKKYSNINNNVPSSAKLTCEGVDCEGVEMGVTQMPSSESFLVA